MEGDIGTGGWKDMTAAVKDESVVQMRLHLALFLIVLSYYKVNIGIACRLEN